MATFTAKDYTPLLGLPGFSNDLLNDHFTLYKGYVGKINEISEKLPAADPSKANYSYAEFSELARREAFAFNGARLHELYFDNLTKDKTKPSDKLAAALDAKFGKVAGGFEGYLRGLALGTLGWVVVSVSRTDAAAGDPHPLRATIFSEHHRYGLVEQEPILVLDIYEHAFARDYGIKKAPYLDAFFAALNWNEVNTRFEKALARLKI